MKLGVCMKEKEEGEEVNEENGGYFRHFGGFEFVVLVWTLLCKMNYRERLIYRGDDAKISGI